MRSPPSTRSTDIVTPITKDLSRPLCPSIFNFDPLVQFIEEDDDGRGGDTRRLTETWGPSSHSLDRESSTENPHWRSPTGLTERSVTAVTTAEQQQAVSTAQSFALSYVR